MTLAASALTQGQRLAGVVQTYTAVLSRYGVEISERQSTHLVLAPAASANLLAAG